jgi:hypothetical protein
MNVYLELAKSGSLINQTECKENVSTIVLLDKFKNPVALFIDNGEMVFFKAAHEPDFLAVLEGLGIHKNVTYKQFSVK